MQILVLVAGTNDPSNADTLADAFIEGLRKIPTTEMEKVFVSNLDIAHFRIEHYDDMTPVEEDFKRIREKVMHADALVIATPVWNFGVPAHLKNLIDRMGSFGLDKETRSKGTFEGKPFYLIFTGGASTLAWKGLMRGTTGFVREGLKYFGATYIGHHFEPKCVPGKGKFGLVVDRRPESLASLRKQGEHFAHLVKTFRETGKLPISTSLYRTLYGMALKFVDRFL